MILISMVSELLPNAASKENEPLVNLLYKTSTSAFVVQLLVVVFTDQMRNFKMKPSWLKSNCAIYTKQCDASGPLRDLLLKLDQIKVILEDGKTEENKYNQHWKQNES